MKKKRAYLLIFATMFVLIFLCSCWYINKKTKLSLESARELLYQDGYLYGVVSDNMKVTLFRVDVETGTYDSMLLNYWMGNERNYVFNGTIAPDGTVYFICERWYTDSEEVHDYLVHCDFNTGTMTELFDANHPEYGWLVQASAVDQGFLLSYRTEGEHGYEIRRLLVSGQGEHLEEWPSFEVSSTYSKLYDREKEHLYYLETDGSVYAGGSDGIFPCVFFNDGTAISQHNAIFCMTEDGVILYNLEEDDPYFVDYRTGSVTKMTDSWLNSQREEFHTIYSMNDMGNQNATVGIGTADYRAIPGIVDGEVLTAVPDAVAPRSRQLEQSLIMTVLIMVGLGLLVGACHGILYLFGGIFPTSLKIICIVIPLLAGSFYLVQYETRQIFTKRYLEQEKSKLYYEARAVAKSIDINMMEDADAYTAQLKLASEQAIRRIESYATIKDLEGKSEINISNLDMVYDIYKLQEGEFYTLTGDQLVCEPASWLNLGQELKNLELCAERKQEVFSMYQGARGDTILGIYVPILSNRQEALGAVSGQLSGMQMKTEVERQVDVVSRSVLMFLAGLLGVLTIVEYISLKPLGELRRAVLSMEAGKMDVRIRVRKENEIGSILQIFNRMFYHIDRHVQQIDALKQAYEPFVPNSLIALLGKEDIRFVNPGDEAELESAILHIDANMMEELMPEIKAKELFDFMNKALLKIVPIMEAHGGIISRFTNAGAEVFFPGEPKQSLMAAIASLHALQDGPGYLNHQKVTFTAGICLGTVRLGILGTDNRLSAAVMSNSGRLSGVLQKTAGIYEAGILISGSAATRIDDFNNQFKSRFFCCLSKEQDPLEDMVFEVFEADSPEQARLKEYTKKSYEEGLHFAAKSQWTEARKALISVLKMNQDDRAAQKYFSLCDEETFQPDGLMKE